MASITNFNRQHKEILDTIEAIEELINKGTVESNAMDISIKINFLAGKLKIHLDSEDKYLYPDLLKGESIELRKMSTSYMNEMGNILSIFTEYKLKFNTKSKILESTQAFLEQTETIFNTIENRISREERELYPLIK